MGVTARKSSVIWNIGNDNYFLIIRTKWIGMAESGLFVFAKVLLRGVGKISSWPCSGSSSWLARRSVAQSSQSGFRWDFTFQELLCWGFCCDNNFFEHSVALIWGLTVSTLKQYSVKNKSQSSWMLSPFYNVIVWMFFAILEFLF